MKVKEGLAPKGSSANEDTFGKGLLWHERGHFAQRRHEEIDHEANGGVSHQRPARPGAVNGRAAGHEQARANAAANGDHGKMPRLEAALDMVDSSV